MTVLIVAEPSGAEVKPATLSTLTAARALGGDIHVLVAGAGVAAAGEAAARIEGAAKVLAADDAIYAHALPEPIADLIAGLAPRYSHVLAPATTFGKNVLPRAAALLDVVRPTGPAGPESPVRGPRYPDHPASPEQRRGLSDSR